MLFYRVRVSSAGRKIAVSSTLSAEDTIEVGEMSCPSGAKGIVVRTTRHSLDGGQGKREKQMIG